MPKATSRFCRAIEFPAIPRDRIKAGFDFSVTDAFKVGGDALFVGSQYMVGDKSNQGPRVPSYAVFGLHSSYQINKTIQVYARADNILDNRYATFGSFFETDACRISPMAERHSWILVRSARCGHAPSTQA